MSITLDASYVHCQRSARRAASSFYYSFWLLPREKRQAMCTLYSFLRRTDDLGDSTASLECRRSSLEAWRSSLERAWTGSFDDPLLPALVDTVQRYEIPHVYLTDVLDGVEMDLSLHRYETFEELQLYCHRVASAVGLACIHIWGFESDRALLLARECGLAFQMTNILRDLKEDALQDRIYLPMSDLRHFNYGPSELKQSLKNERFFTLMEYEIDRVEKLFDAALELELHLSPDGRPVFRAMVSTYRGLLEEIKRRRGDVFSRRIRIGRWKRLRIVLGWLLFPRRAGSALLSTG